MSITISGKRVSRFRYALIGVTAILASAATVSLPASASASVVQPTITQSAPNVPGTYVGTFYLINVFNLYCLDGRLGTGNVTVQPCNTDGTHQDWLYYRQSNGTYILQNEFNFYCLDGRLGTGNVTLQPCNADGTHLNWYVHSLDNVSVYLQNEFNGYWLDGRLGTGNVTLQPPFTDDGHTQWCESNPFCP